MNDYVLYKHTNKLNGKLYIGITNDVKRRWRQNGIEYRPQKGDDPNGRPFWNAIQKYGWDGFTHEIIQNKLTFKEACDAEVIAISKANSTDKSIGYNVAAGGNGGHIYKKHPRGMLGKHQSQYEIESHKEMMEDQQRNPMTNGDVVWGVTHPHPRGFAGHKRTQEEKDKISATVRAKRIGCKRMAVTYPSGRVAVFDSATECFLSLGISQQIWYSVRDKGGVYHLSNHSKCKDEAHRAIDGCKFEYVKG